LKGIERTYNFKQDDILKHVEVGAAQKVYDLRLPDLGPYRVDFTRNGRFMLLGGRRGHLALMDWSQSQLECEVQVSFLTPGCQKGSSCPYGLEPVAVSV
jgi:U3 small nucleolar RNA-associated protein 7